MKELTLKEWSAYLPYGLICEVKDQGEIKTDTLSGVYDNKELVFHNIVESHQGFESVKPILYDLSWLTREITHDGETFIPIDKIHIYENNSDYLIEMIITGLVEKIIWDMLVSWKFNVFSLPDELIVRVSEDFNHYK